MIAVDQQIMDLKTAMINKTKAWRNIESIEKRANVLRQAVVNEGANPSNALLQDIATLSTEITNYSR
jgi:hypothetical protein